VIVWGSTAAKLGGGVSRSTSGSPRGTSGETAWPAESGVNGSQAGLPSSWIIDGAEFSLTQNGVRRGSRPTVGFDGFGNVVVLYRGTDASKLWYVHGVIDADGQIVGEEQLLDMSLDRR
jgi:hypothetical protein